MYVTVHVRLHEKRTELHGGAAVGKFYTLLSLWQATG